MFIILNPHFVTNLDYVYFMQELEKAGSKRYAVLWQLLLNFNRKNQ